MKSWTGASFPLAILLSLSGLTLWLKFAAEIPDEKPVDKRRHDPDTFIENFVAATVDANGHPMHHLSAQRLVHFPDDDSSELSNPILRYTPPGRAEITLNAKRGKALAGSDEISLLEQVRIEQTGSLSAPGWIATMPDLTAHPPLGTAYTKSPVVLTQGTARIDGIGFSLDQNTRTVSLNAAVRGHFPPRISKPD